MCSSDLTDEYRQWYEYHEAKGDYDLLGDSPSPYELLYNKEYEHLHELGELDDDLYFMLKRMDSE